MPTLPTQIAAGLDKIQATIDDRLEPLERTIGQHGRAIDESLRMYARLTVGGAPLSVSEPGRNRLAEFNAALRSRLPHASPVNAEQLAAYERAELAYWRMGGAAHPNIRADMSVGSESGGGYLVSPERSAAIKMRIFETSPMRQLASVIQINSDAWEQPLSVSDLTAGGWVTEQASRTETASPLVGIQKIEVHEQYAEPHATQKILDDGDINIAQFIENKIADKFSRDENAAFVSGSGINRPRGFLDYSSAAVTTDDSSRAWGVLQYVPTGVAGGFATDGSADDPDVLIDLQHTLKPAYRANATWLMNRATAARVRKMKDADGKYLWSDSLIAGQPATLLGSPVALGEDMPSVASGTYSIAYGDFRQGYLIVDRLGMTVLRDPFTQHGVVKFYARKRVGGDVVDFDAVKLLKFATS
jgi:HK97 family phage major capsid protein